MASAAGPCECGNLAPLPRTSVLTQSATEIFRPQGRSQLPLIDEASAAPLHPRCPFRETCWCAPSQCGSYPRFFPLALWLLSDHVAAVRACSVSRPRSIGPLRRKFRHSLLTDQRTAGQKGRPHRIHAWAVILPPRISDHRPMATFVHISGPHYRVDDQAVPPHSWPGDQPPSGPEIKASLSPPLVGVITNPASSARLVIRLAVLFGNHFP